jgi:hypothetical protein
MYVATVNLEISLDLYRSPLRLTQLIQSTVLPESITKQANIVASKTLSYSNFFFTKFNYILLSRVQAAGIR